MRRPGAVAEDLTAQTFLGAVQAVRRDRPGHAVEGLADGGGPQQAGRPLAPAGPRGAGPAARWPPPEQSYDDPWDAELDAVRAREVLDRLSARTTGWRSPCATSTTCPSPRWPSCIDRTVHATEALLVRARARLPPGLHRGRGAAMPDPFDALRAPVVPTDPDPGFAARLRARLEQALRLPEGVDVTVTTLEPLEPRRPRPAPPRMVLTPYLAVADARRALDWYADAFGARLRRRARS